MQAIEQFLYHEASLLDSGDFAAWLDLFTDDAIYWVPSRPDQQDAETTVSIIYEDLNLLRLRVHRLLHPRAHALIPKPLTLHTVSNVQTTIISEQESCCQSALIMIEYRAEQQTLYAATVQHQLRLIDKQWRIAHKRVDLLNYDATHGIMSVPF